jgi:tRNA(fMet)-specific endonuclease VapC
MALAMLDTSACIEILRGQSMPERWRSYQFCISTIVEAELWSGVYHSGGQVERIKVEKLLGAIESVEFDRKAAERTGKVLGNLAKLGMPIGDFDAQIAGHALSLRAQLVTRNPKHFGRVDGLKLLEW